MNICFDLLFWQIYYTIQGPVFNLIMVWIKQTAVFLLLVVFFQISYKQSCEQEQGEYNYPATLTPGYQSQRKLDPLKDVSFLKFHPKPLFMKFTIKKCYFTVRWSTLVDTFTIKMVSYLTAEELQATHRPGQVQPNNRHAWDCFSTEKRRAGQQCE